MVGQKNKETNQLHRLLPEGLVVDTAWLDAHGYRRQWREKYAAQGWLEGVVRGVYQRPTGNVVQAISLAARDPLQAAVSRSASYAEVGLSVCILKWAGAQAPFDPNR
ncbi:AbiEi antitoxin N-terminal domain-containing protein [Mesorhizobium sp.]|uniref:AbiEi antitoxin N-terminal domain-containing protein n=1 Tax=Mesorhizobium sp. TaxID=1871066 RepID=UPI003419767C